MDIPANIYCTKSFQLGNRVDYLKSHQPTNIIIYQMTKESSQGDETVIMRYFLDMKLYSILQIM